MAKFEHDQFTNLFGGEEALDFKAISQIAESLLSERLRFFRVPEAKFQAAIDREDLYEINVLYLKEILSRAAFTSVTSYIRAWKWLDGMRLAYEGELFLPFCGNLRALIEFTSDAHCALAGVAASLARSKNTFNSVLRRKYRYGLDAKEIEDQLIHFSHARKVERGQSANELHHAKAPYAYIKELERAGIEGLYEFYSLLCQFTHPAAESVQYLIRPVNEDYFTVAGDSDRLRIDAMLAHRKAILKAVIAFAFNSPSVLLKVLLHMDDPDVHVSVFRGVELRDVQLWQECKVLLRTPVQNP
jgi:hypothetical protein